MELKTYMKALTPDEVREFAHKLDTSVPYLYQLSSGHRKAGVKILARIQGASGGKLTPADLRPELAA